MTEFAVWAPDRNRVSVLVGDQRIALDPSPGGWWRTEAPDHGHGTDYAFLLDDDATPLPDPRSRWQPKGVHERSRVYDHEAFWWTDETWTGRALAGSVLYECHIGTFTGPGTFDAAIGRLDHLVSLGVDLVEVLPVNAVDGPVNWGYDGVGWYAVTENYGGPDAFKRFVDACHARGLGVVLDVVYNHLGPSGAYLDRFGPYFAGSNIWGPSLNLDAAGSDEVRRYMIDNALMWLRDFHVDGLRIDAVHALRDTRAQHVLEQLAVEVTALEAHVGRPLSLIAESDLNDPRMITAREGGGYGLDAQWADDVHHCLHSVLTGEGQGYYGDFAEAGLDGLAHVLTRGFLHEGTWSSFRQRSHGAPIDTARIPGSRLVTYLQNHDQIGNRATGDRLTHTLSPGLLACGAALLFTSGFTPMLFMGEEWGARTPWQFFSRFGDPDLQKAVRDGRRAEFADHGWDDAAEVPDPNAESTFADSRLDWSEPEQEPHATLLRMHRELIALRRAWPELSDPWLDRIGVDVHEQARTLVVARGRMRVVVNLGPEPVTLSLGSEITRILLASEPTTSDGSSFTVPAEAFAICRVAE
ncbi:Malto-oligosyltrehalose trehalohydrolase [Pseudonocardia sp. Ae406_Ps2]|uniref:malto-oligosyltrehalose trehalohydrolase n=1 Tax=unclassified Pseudonocardia TaxID=2619320 RepID=UPI00094AAD19|nr:MULTISPECIES: malto-oligosyltrehalose trehalohydrolase [unclassified Pseudonocardia]OLM00186.1 Malto-oligosyltrehalose trehalohydrolase [Pseudonocardia sp. Ae406_Ps2]OLM08021.1 Malto-oligosyltrehalose trehalohydrolase [Pseudonocardia sp. Ae331_Ps2]OLM21755.1 Malto-oligosyltrehalose trehalohydrolase [Pseudonocardia sp. Ae706_Ps2]